MSAEYGKSPEGNPPDFEQDFEEKVLKSKYPVLVAFLTHWSPPCHVMEQILDGILHQTDKLGATFVRMNADDHPAISMWYEIREVPTLLLFVNGIVRTRIVGTISQAALVSKLAAVIRATAAGGHPQTDGTKE